jgi:hypothetical protein
VFETIQQTFHSKENKGFVYLTACPKVPKSAKKCQNCAKSTKVQKVPTITTSGKVPRRAKQIAKICLKVQNNAKNAF